MFIIWQFPPSFYYFFHSSQKKSPIKILVISYIKKINYYMSRWEKQSSPSICFSISYLCYMPVDDFKTSYYRRYMCSVGSNRNSNNDLLDILFRNISIWVIGNYIFFLWILINIMNFRFIIHVFIHRKQWFNLNDKLRTIKTSFAKRKLVTHVKLIELHFYSMILIYLFQ